MPDRNVDRDQTGIPTTDPVIDDHREKVVDLEKNESVDWSRDAPIDLTLNSVRSKSENAASKDISAPTVHNLSSGMPDTSAVEPVTGENSASCSADIGAYDDRGTPGRYLSGLDNDPELTMIQREQYRPQSQYMGAYSLTNDGMRVAVH